MEYVHAYVVENIEQTTTKQAKLLLWASYVSSTAATTVLFPRRHVHNQTGAHSSLRLHLKAVQKPVPVTAASKLTYGPTTFEEEQERRSGEG